MNKILIVDDSAELLEVMKIFLDKKGYITATASNKAQLFELIPVFKPDLVLLDVFLMNEDGRDICRELKNMDTSKFLCIIMFSASPKDLVDFKKYGADGCLEKPFGLTDILNKIKEVMDVCKKHSLPK